MPTTAASSAAAALSPSVFHRPPTSALWLHPIDSPRSRAPGAALLPGGLHHRGASSEAYEAVAVEVKVDSRIRVTVPLKEYLDLNPGDGAAEGVSKAPDLDLMGMEGAIKQFVGLLKASIPNASLASLTREIGPKVVKGDLSKKSVTPKVAHHHHQPHHFFTPTISVSDIDSSLKFIHVLYNLSPAAHKQAIKHKHGSFIISSGALAILSGAKTGRSPRDKRVVKDETTAQELWWGKLSQH